MFYRVTMSAPFTQEDEGDDFYHDGELALPKSHTINPDTPNEERGYIMLEKCYHDESPTIPCEIVKQAFGPD